MIYCIDLDGTLCKTKGNDYPNSVPIPEAIEKVNRLREQGHTINIFTGRGSRSGKEWRMLTYYQLLNWGVKFDELIMGKPTCDFIIDDKAINSKDWMNGKERCD